MATMTDLDELALAMPEATKEVEKGRPTYRVHGKMFCFHRESRPDAVDPETGERLDDVLAFRVADLGVKELLLSDARGVYFTTPALGRVLGGPAAHPRPRPARRRRAARPRRGSVADTGAEAARDGVAREAAGERGLGARFGLLTAVEVSLCLPCELE
jgi:hypothetical protein